MAKRPIAAQPASEELLALFGASIATRGTTTGNGAAGGDSLVDAGLIGYGADTFVAMLAVIYPDNPALIDSQSISAFNNATGEITLAAPYKGGQILAGTPYTIVTLISADADVALLLARVGWEGATSLADKLTLARAALLDEITVARMAQLDPAGLEADIAVVDAAIAALNDLSADEVRQSVCLVGDPANSIGKALFEIYVNRLTAARAAHLDANISTRAAEDGGRLQTTEGAVGAIEGATTLHNKLTAARAGYLNNINQAGLLQVTAARAGNLDELAAANVPADIDTLLGRLTAARAGYIDDIKVLTRTQSGAQTITDAAAQVVGSAVEDTVPFKISGFISLHNLALNDGFLMLEEVRDRDDATYREYARYTYSDVQTSPMIHFNEKVCRGWRIKMQRTAGANREITYQYFKEVQSA